MAKEVNNEEAVVATNSSSNVKIGAAFVAGAVIGAGVVYYLTRKNAAPAAGAVLPAPAPVLEVAPAA